MSSTSAQVAPKRSSTSKLFSSRNKKAPGRTLDSATIADDIAAFKKSGGRIEVLGNTPYRAYQPTAFRSKADTQRKARTAAPVKSAARKSAARS